jgi:AMMECR1 domain-containing protein
MTRGADDADALLSTARSALAEALAGRQLMSSGAGPQRAVMVNLTVYDGHRLRASMSARGPTMREAIARAAWRAAHDGRFGRSLAVEPAGRPRLELWIRTGRTRVARLENMDDGELGLHGVELRVGAASAYYKPSVALTKRVTSHERLLSKLSTKAGLPTDAWRAPDAKVWRTSWEHHVERDGGRSRALCLRRLRPVDPPAGDRSSVERALGLALDRLLAIQREDGSYLYRYRPFDDEIVPGSTNLVRQAGCAYAIARASEHVGDAARRVRLRDSAERCVTWLFSHGETDADGALFLSEPDGRDQSRPRKLGAVALTLLAVQHGGLEESFARQRQALLTAILSRQNANGSFRCFSDTSTVADDGRAQRYYPGEALLAMTHEACRGEEAASEALRLAFPWYRGFFRRARHPAFVVWQAGAWAAMTTRTPPGARTAPAGEHARFVFEMLDWLVGRQLTDADRVHPDFVGGFRTHSGRPDSSSATFTEAVMYGLSVARAVSDGQRADRYAAVARSALGFLLRLQVAPELAMMFPAPERAVGATTRSLTDFSMRCDYDQHLIAALGASLDEAAVVGPGPAPLG